ncbi:MAG: PorP/SprF family type IX secretion system membrane protein [Bacteroidetes bacterium]|nr:PorP/SprF family type IX secretion system membrane protein [Bacteroidota bacterium]
MIKKLKVKSKKPKSGKESCLFLAFYFLLFTSSIAQDIHYSQFFFAPANYNPAHIGDFDGDYRFIGNERRQWASVTIPYQTFAAAADARDFLAVKGLGTLFSFQTDNAGDSHFTTTVVNVGASYRYDLDTNNTIVFGIQAGVSNKQFNTKDLKYDNQYNGFYYDPSISSIESYDKLSATYFNFNAGLKWKFKVNEQTNLFFGASAYNITQPKESFMQNVSITLDRRFNVELGAEHRVAPRWSILPKILMSFQGKYSEYLIGSMVKYDFISEPFNEWNLLAGAWGRTSDAGNLFAGLMYNNWTFGMSYDINLSNLEPASQYKGGLELSVIYILKKLPPRMKFKICPDFL